MDKKTTFRKLRSLLILKEPMLGSIAMLLEPSFESSGQGFLAYVNARNQIGLPEEFFSLSQDEQLFVLAHEILHLALQHLVRLENKDQNLWNIATDLVINDMLSSAGFKKPSAILLNQELSRENDKILSAERVYERLLKNGYKARQQAGFDKHDYNGGSAGPAVSSDDIKKIVTQFGRGLIGRKPGELAEAVFANLLPKINWQDVLRKFLSKAVTEWPDWTRRKNYLPASIYAPRLKQDEKLLVLVAIDVSGSIDSDELNRFFSETKKILVSFSNVTAKVVTFDTVIQNEFTRLPEEIKITGRGGTDFECIKDYVLEHKVAHDVLIVMSDGYANNSDLRLSDKPTVYLIVNNPGFTGPGKVIHLEE